MGYRTFYKGSGTYRCVSCNKVTRDTGHGERDGQQCYRCYRLEELDNAFSDGDLTTEEYNAAKREIPCEG